MKTSEAINEIAKALAAFQGDVKQPEKDGNNPHFKSKYITLDGTVKAIHDCAPNHGLSYTQMPVSNEMGVGVVTVLFHTSGQFIEFDPFVLPLEKKTAQGVGSGLTYSKRYALSAAFGIVADVDDDGHEATEQAGNKGGNSGVAMASDKQINLIKAKVKDLSAARRLPLQDVYAKIGIAENTIGQMKSKDASQLISDIDGWIESAKADQQGA